MDRLELFSTGPNHVYVQHADAHGHGHSEFVVHRQVLDRYTPRQLAKLNTFAPCLADELHYQHQPRKDSTE